MALEIGTIFPTMKINRENVPSINPTSNGQAFNSFIYYYVGIFEKDVQFK